MTNKEALIEEAKSALKNYTATKDKWYLELYNNVVEELKELENGEKEDTAGMVQ